MLLVNIKSKLSVFSTWILGFFILTLMIGAFISHFFQAPLIKERLSFHKYTNLFTTEELTKYSLLSIKNSLGEFKLARDLDNNWSLTHPREFEANNDLIENLFSTLAKIKIKKIFDYDPINISNFSLDNPIYEIDLKNSSGEINNIKLGLINPIDNSTYIYSSQKNAIYHIEALSFSMESLDLSDFVDAHIFSMKLEDIKSIEIFRGNQSGSSFFKLEKFEDKWLGKKKNELAASSVERFLKELLTLKSLFIVDKQSQELTDKLQQYLTRPFYSLVIQSSNGEQFSYEISHIITQLPDIKMEKRSNFIIRASNRKYPYIVNKSFLGIFNQREKSFRDPLKKLFY